VCELCNLEKKTKWYYEDDTFIICDCLTCKVPMIVAKYHHSLVETMRPEVFESYVNGLVRGVLKRKFHFRREQRKVKDHWHWHIEIHV